MDLQTLQSKVMASRLLTQTDKRYWLENLAQMNVDQLGKLETILKEAEELPWNEEMQRYMLIAAKATAALS